MDNLELQEIPSKDTPTSSSIAARIESWLEVLPAPSEMQHQFCEVTVSHVAELDSSDHAAPSARIEGRSPESKADMDSGQQLIYRYANLSPPIVRTLLRSPIIRPRAPTPTSKPLRANVVVPNGTLRVHFQPYSWGLEEDEHDEHGRSRTQRPLPAVVAVHNRFSHAYHQPDSWESENDGSGPPESEREAVVSLMAPLNLYKDIMSSRASHGPTRIYEPEPFTRPPRLPQLEPPRLFTGPTPLQQALFSPAPVSEHASKSIKGQAEDAIAEAFADNKDSDNGHTPSTSSLRFELECFCTHHSPLSESALYLLADSEVETIVRRPCGYSVIDSQYQALASIDSLSCSSLPGPGCNEEGVIDNTDPIEYAQLENTCSTNSLSSSILSRKGYKGITLADSYTYNNSAAAADYQSIGSPNTIPFLAEQHAQEEAEHEHWHKRSEECIQMLIDQGRLSKETMRMLCYTKYRLPPDLWDREPATSPSAESDDSVLPEDIVPKGQLPDEVTGCAADQPRSRARALQQIILACLVYNTVLLIFEHDKPGIAAVIVKDTAGFVAVLALFALCLVMTMQWLTGRWTVEDFDRFIAEGPLLWWDED
jgi:hypothetical protein